MTETYTQIKDLVAAAHTQKALSLLSEISTSFGDEIQTAVIVVQADYQRMVREEITKGEKPNFRLINSEILKILGMMQNVIPPVTPASSNKEDEQKAKFATISEVRKYIRKGLIKKALKHFFSAKWLDAEQKNEIDVLLAKFALYEQEKEELTLDDKERKRVSFIHKILAICNQWENDN